MDDKTLVERIVARQMVAGDIHAGTYADMNNQIEALQARVEALEAALRFYARENSWKSCGVYMSGQSQPSSAEVDRGNKARKALEGSGNG